MNIAVLRMFKARRGQLVDHRSTSFYPRTAMRKFLLIVATAIFLYSPYSPSWGRTAVNAAILLSFASFCFRNMPKRRYYDEHEDYN